MGFFPLDLMKRKQSSLGDHTKFSFKLRAQIIIENDSCGLDRLLPVSECLYLKVGGVHTQGEGVQLAQVEETSF